MATAGSVRKRRRQADLNARSKPPSASKVPRKPPGISKRSVVLQAAVTATKIATALAVLYYLYRQTLKCYALYGHERVMRNTQPDEIGARLLPTLDIQSEFPLPSKPLHQVSIAVPRREEDLTPYPYAHSRAMHGRLAGNFPPSNMPQLDISLDREFPDFRDPSCSYASYYQPSVASELPSASVVIIFADEPFETLLRSIHSVLNNTPPSLLKEIILVDDGSEDPYITEEGGLLEQYITHLPKVFLTRTGERSGIMRARTHGIMHATADIFIILDSHIETQPGWIEPLVHRVNEDPWSFVTPLIDSIQMPNNYKPVQGGIPCHLGIIWRLQDHAFNPQRGISPQDRLTNDPTQPTSSPVMAGGLFAASKAAFIAAGGYDLGMGAWGAENVELGFRLWMCGARIDCMPCSRVAHIFDRGQTYSTGINTKVGQDEYNKNRLRTAAVWMDEFAGIPHQILGRPKWSQAGDLDHMFRLRSTLQCQSFQWFLENVWPESHVVHLPDDLPYDGPIRPLNRPNACLYGGTRGSLLTQRDTNLHVGDLKSAKHCPWFFYFPKIGAIAGGFDEETVLYEKSNSSLSFDWNRDGSVPNARWYLNRVGGYKDGEFDLVMLRSHFSNRCLTFDDSQGVSDVVLEPCISSDSSQLWLWRQSSYVMDQNNHYTEWLKAQSEIKDLSDTD